MRKENFKGGWFRQGEVEIKLIHFIWVDHFNEENGLSLCGILTIAHKCWASRQRHPLPGTWLYGQLGSIIQYISQPKHHDYIWLPLGCRPTSFPYCLSFCLFPNEPSLLPYIHGELASRLPQWVSSTTAVLQQSKACWQDGAYHRKSLFIPLLLPFIRSWCAHLSFFPLWLLWNFAPPWDISFSAEEWKLWDCSYTANLPQVMEHSNTVWNWCTLHWAHREIPD